MEDDAEYVYVVEDDDESDSNAGKMFAIAGVSALVGAGAVTVFNKLRSRFGKSKPEVAEAIQAADSPVTPDEE